LCRLDDEAFDLLAALRELSGELGEFAVLLLDGLDLGYAGLPCRLIARRKPPEQVAEQRRRMAQREREKRTPPPSAERLEAAEWLIVLTSLTPSETAEQVLELYRLRWLVELAFKRAKSLGHIDRLPAKDKKLARSWLYANLIAAPLFDDLAQDLLDSPSCASALTAGRSRSGGYTVRSAIRSAPPSSAPSPGGCCWPIPARSSGASPNPNAGAKCRHQIRSPRYVSANGGEAPGNLW
jgi:hypothetical protein